MLIKEVCIENLTNIHDLIEKKVKRIELCDNLAEGGTGVSPGVSKRAVELGKKHGFIVMAMVRPRGGDFLYSDEEISIMLGDIEYLKSIDCDGVVFGCVTKENKLDKANTLKLIEASKGMQITFHMAFDVLLCSERFLAIDFLIENKVNRILTHGGHGTMTICETVPQLREYVKYAERRITILPGGGVNDENAQMLVEELGINELHGTKLLCSSTNLERQNYAL